MILWTHDTATAATGGKATGAWNASRVVIDSRSVQPGDLFVAIKGERLDGHQFVAEAFKNGAAAVIVSSPPAGGGNYILVPDTLAALVALGRAARARSYAKIVGVTGSVGKTSAKEMIRLALSAHGKTYATTGNLNNHIGTPLSLANLPPDAAFAVFEMGMNHAGEIAQLTRMVRPHVAVITNVEGVHLEFFDSLEAIADAKAEIFEGMEASGVAVLNADSRHLGRLKMAVTRCGLSRVLTFGEGLEGDVRLIAYQPTSAGVSFDASVGGALVSCRLGAIGRHWAKTALMALAVAQAFALDREKTARALGAFTEPAGRGQLVPLAIAGGRAMIINDSYNASPPSMRAAFAKTVEVWEALGKKGRKLAALGDMLELGETSPVQHAALAEDLVRAGFDCVFTAGALMEHLHRALPQAMRGAHVGSAMKLLPLLLAECKADDILLLKGSHGSMLYQLADAMTESMETPHAV